MLGKLLSQSRFLIIIAVIGSLVAATLVMLFGLYDILRILLSILQGNLESGDVTKKTAVGAIELIELFLLGTVLYVVALGLYQLFIEQEIELPDWLEIKTLDNLKERLLATVLVMLAVSFFGYAVTWDGNWNILAVGLATGFVIFGVSYGLAHALKDRTTVETNSSKNGRTEESG